MTRFEEDLLKFDKVLNIKKCLKKHDKILLKIGNLRKQYQRASAMFDISVKKDDKSGNATRIYWKHQPKPDTKNCLPDVYCLRTSQSVDSPVRHEAKRRRLKTVLQEIITLPPV